MRVLFYSPNFRYPSMNRVLEADNSRSMNRVLEANNSLNGMNSVMRSGGRDVSITDEVCLYHALVV
jgi:hypothetical protein